MMTVRVVDLLFAICDEQQYTRICFIVNYIVLSQDTINLQDDRKGGRAVEWTLQIDMRTQGFGK